MYRVILIDNEPWILEGMLALMPWQAYGFSVAGTYTDPIMAYEAIIRNPPELVVVDIRMPEMDGLTLIHKAREQGVNSEFVIVSGYAQFDYARKAMTDHALDYLLKPVEPDDMARLLARLSQSLSANRAKEQGKAAALLRAEKDFRVPLGPAPPGTRFVAARIRNIGEEALDAHLGEHTCVRRVLYPYGDAGAIALFSGGDALREQLKTAFAALVCERPGARVGLSGIKENPLTLAAALDEAEIAAIQHFIDPDASLTLYRPPRSDLLTKLAQEIFLYFVLQQGENLSSAIRRIPGTAKESGVCMDGIAGFWNRLAALVNVEGAVDSTWCEMRSATAEMLVREFHDIGAMCERLEAVLGGMVRKRSAIPREGDVDERFYDLLDEISGHYEKKLALHDLARRHRLNISYCCKLFKRVTGGTFSDYLIRLRMERARDAMRTAGIPASKVYSLVGYSDYYYFRRSYQRYYGISPVDGG